MSSKKWIMSILMKRPPYRGIGGPVLKFQVRSVAVCLFQKCALPDRLILKWKTRCLQYGLLGLWTCNNQPVLNSGPVQTDQVIDHLLLCDVPIQFEDLSGFNLTYTKISTCLRGCERLQKITILVRILI